MLTTANVSSFEELVIAAREADLPYSFYACEDNRAVFVIKHDRWGRELLLEVFTEKDTETGKDTWWFRAKCYDRPEYAIAAAKRRINMLDY